LALDSQPELAPARCHIERVMRFSNGTEFRFAMPKYSHIWGSLLQIGGLLFVISFNVQPPVRDWIVNGGAVILFTGFVIALVGAVAARREWPAKPRAEKKC
jgi:protein-S-isoprenylcysteine O-methyltransferase Ste14